MGLSCSIFSEVQTEFLLKMGLTKNEILQLSSSPSDKQECTRLSEYLFIVNKYKKPLRIVTLNSKGNVENRMDLLSKSAGNYVSSTEYVKLIIFCTTNKNNYKLITEPLAGRVYDFNIIDGVPVLIDRLSKKELEQIK